MRESSFSLSSMHFLPAFVPERPASAGVARRTASQVDESRCGAFLQQEDPRLAAEFSRAAEQAVEDERAPDVALQAVLGREPDPAENLLAVAARSQRRVSRRRLGQQRA